MGLLRRYLRCRGARAANACCLRVQRATVCEHAPSMRAAGANGDPDRAGATPPRDICLPSVLGVSTRSSCRWEEERTIE